jgi:hypothetical protein
MEPFIQHFVRDTDGAWQCISPATLVTPSGRIQVTPGSRFMPGTVFMGFDVAAWLDMHAASAFRDGARGRATWGRASTG